MEKKTGEYKRFDCSRNAVLKVETVKKWIDILQKMGYNALELYTEDTYEVAGEPYFGYLRGRYSGAEIREMDAYAAAHGKVDLKEKYAKGSNKHFGVYASS